MTTSNDFTKAFQDALSSLNVDTSAVEESFKSTAALAEKMSKISLAAAEQSAELQSKWTKDTLAKMGAVSTGKTDPAEVGKVVSDFAASSAETTTENMTAFAEILKKVQLETVELLMSAGKEMGEDAQAAMQKATASATKATKGKK